MLFPHFLLVKMLAECVDPRLGRDSLGAFVGVVELFIASISSKSTSRILGRPKTLAMPPLLCSSHTLRLVDEHSSASTLPHPSCARPIIARRDEVPRTRIADTIAVMNPRGAIEKIRLSAALRTGRGMVQHLWRDCWQSHPIR